MATIVQRTPFSCTEPVRLKSSRSGLIILIVIVAASPCSLNGSISTSSDLNDLNKLISLSRVMLCLGCFAICSKSQHRFSKSEFSCCAALMAAWTTPFGGRKEPAKQNSVSRVRMIIETRIIFRFLTSSSATPNGRPSVK